MYQLLRFRFSFGFFRFTSARFSSACVVLAALSLAVVAIVMGGCASGPRPGSPDVLAEPVIKNRRRTPFSPLASPIRFSDISKSAGVVFKHNNAAFGLKWIPESMGAGCAFFDYDNDGWPDIFLVNGRDWTPAEIASYNRKNGIEARREHNFVPPRQPPRRRTTSALLRNNRDGTFSDVTRNSGLGIEMQGMGVAAGDYDSDGKTDLYVSALGHNYLFRNMSTDAGARFEEVAKAAGVLDGDWSTSSAWFDYDRDGLLDLFVCHYLQWSPATDVYTSYSRPGFKSYSAPADYQGVACRLYHNIGKGRFQDISARSGVQTRRSAKARDAKARDAKARTAKGRSDKSQEQLLGKSLGVVICDADADGWPDIVVANDTQPTFFLRNNRDGTFSETASRAGLSVGNPRFADGGMGIDAADIDHSGRESIVIGYYADQLMGLYQNRGKGTFENVAAYAEMRRPGTNFVTFGCVFADLDNDTWPDILAANGHVMDDVHHLNSNLSYPQRPLFFLNRKTAPRVKFDEVGLNAGDLKQPIIGRGLALADIDLDGDLDALISVNGGVARLLRNDGGNNHNAIRVTLEGSRSNRSGLGAQVEVRANGLLLRRTVRSGSSYLSQSELPLSIGIGRARQAQVLVRWPSGTETKISNVPANVALTIRENKGVTRQKPLRK